MGVVTQPETGSAESLRPDNRRESVFNPSIEQMRADVVAANERAERLAGRIVAAQAAIRKGVPTETVYKILGGTE